MLIYGRINSTKSPASLACNVCEPKLMPEVERVRSVTVAQLVEALHYKPEGRRFDGVIGIFH
jgi:hypothetical protein